MMSCSGFLFLFQALSCCSFCISQGEQIDQQAPRLSPVVLWESWHCYSKERMVCCLARRSPSVVGPPFLGTMSWGSAGPRHEDGACGGLGKAVLPNPPTVQ